MDAFNCLGKEREKGELCLGKYRCNSPFGDKVFRGVILWDLPNLTDTHPDDNNMESDRDWAVELNNFLQEHPTGNLTPLFGYKMSRDRSDDNNDIHTAQAMFNGRCYGEWKARRIGIAKREAARQALEYFKRNGVPGYAA